MKKITSLMLALVMSLVLCVPAFAAGTPESSVEPHLVMRETIGYSDKSHYVNYEGIRVGSVSGDNRLNSTPLQLDFHYETSGTTTGNFGGSVSAEKKNFVINDLTGKLQFDVSISRSWTKGTIYSVQAIIAPGECQIVSGYIPIVSTSGSWLVKVYNDSAPNSYYIEEVPASASGIPAKDHIHYVVAPLKVSDYQLIKDSSDPAAMLEELGIA